jgi:hypothetical protein
VIDANTIAFCALAVAAINFGMAMFDRVWGSGNKVATSKATMEKYVDTEVEKLRGEVFLKHDNSAGNVGQALVSVKDIVHSMQLEAANFRTFVAETYMRRDSYYKASEDLKRDVNTAFEKIDKRLERMEDTMAENRKQDRG